MNSLPDLDRAAFQIDPARRRDPDAGLCRLVHPARVLEPDGHTHAAPVAAGAPVIAGPVRDNLEPCPQIGIDRAFAGHVGFAEAFHILHTQIERIAPQRAGDDVYLGFRRPGGLRAAKASIRPGGRRVREDTIAVDIQMLPPVWSGQTVACFLGDERARIRIGAGVEQYASGPGDESPVGHDARFHIQNRRMLALRQETFFRRHAEPDRPAGFSRQQNGDGLGFAIVFRPISGAEIGHPDPNAVLGILEDTGQLLAQRKRILRTGPELDDVAVHASNGNKRLKVKMLIPRKHEPVFEDMIAGVERGSIAGPV